MMSSNDIEPLRCLVVEDQLMFSQLLCTLVDAMPGIQVIGTATSQAEALEQCTAQPPPDLLLLDLALPEGPGLAIADALLAHHPSAKVVVLSGEAASCCSSNNEVSSTMLCPPTGAHSCKPSAAKPNGWCSRSKRCVPCCATCKPSINA